MIGLQVVWLFGGESDSGYGCEWTALRKKVDSGSGCEWKALREGVNSGSEGVGSLEERRDRDWLFGREA